MLDFVCPPKIVFPGFFLLPPEGPPDVRPPESKIFFMPSFLQFYILLALMLVPVPLSLSTPTTDGSGQFDCLVDLPPRVSCPPHPPLHCMVYVSSHNVSLASPSDTVFLSMPRRYMMSLPLFSFNRHLYSPIIRFGFFSLFVVRGNKILAVASLTGSEFRYFFRRGSLASGYRVSPLYPFGPGPFLRVCSSCLALGDVSLLPLMICTIFCPTTLPLLPLRFLVFGFSPAFVLSM